MTKTTIEIPDTLMEDAKAYGRRHTMPFRAVVESALRKLLDEEAKTAVKPFKLKKHHFGGEGMVKPFTWEEIRDLIYEGRS